MPVSRARVMMLHGEKVFLWLQRFTSTTAVLRVKTSRSYLRGFFSRTRFWLNPLVFFTSCRLGGPSGRPLAASPAGGADVRGPHLRRGRGGAAVARLHRSANHTPVWVQAASQWTRKDWRVRLDPAIDTGFYFRFKTAKNTTHFFQRNAGMVESCQVVKSCASWCETPVWTLWNAVTTFSDRKLHKLYILRVESVCTKQVTWWQIPHCVSKICSVEFLWCHLEAETLSGKWNKAAKKKEKCGFYPFLANKMLQWHAGKVNFAHSKLLIKCRTSPLHCFISR